MTEAAIVLENLSKNFGQFKAVENVSLQVQSGDVFGFMGHNGAGKTTTLHMLLGLLKPSSGQARVLGHDIVKDSLKIRRLCGFLPANYSLPKDMTPHSFLTYIAAMFGEGGPKIQGRIAELLERFGLSAVANKKLGGFSTGMSQKVGLAQALLNQPRLLFLDEPTAGLDPLGRHDLLKYIQSLAQDQGVTVLFSTHILSDIESICQDVAILHQGRLLANGPLQALKTAHQSEKMDDLYLKLVRGSGHEIH